MSVRERIMTAPAFNGDCSIAAILFENTRRGLTDGVPVSGFLWDRGIVSFLKVNQRLAQENNGMRLMTVIPALPMNLGEGVRLGVFGTKMRSTIGEPSTTGIKSILEQQFETARQIARHGLMPIVEPEVPKDSDDKAAAGGRLRMD